MLRDCIHPAGMTPYLYGAVMNQTLAVFAACYCSQTPLQSLRCWLAAKIALNSDCLLKTCAVLNLINSLRQRGQPDITHKH